MTDQPHEPSAAALADTGTDAPERGAENRGTPAHVLPNGEVRGSGAGAGGGGGREDQDTDAPTRATEQPAADDGHGVGGDGRKHGSA